MTCIAGLVDKGRIYIGADSAGVSGLELDLRSDPKVFRNGEFLIGFTSSFRMGQILRYAFTPPEIGREPDLFRYMVTSFVDAAREAFESKGFAKKQSGEESAGTFLVGVRGRLFRVEQDYQVCENLCRYDAVGCGNIAAKAAFFATPDRGSISRVRVALMAAEEFSAGVRGPFLIEALEERQPP